MSFRFSHYIYSTYGRAHLLTHYGTPMKETKYTPAGVLKGESGNKFEKSMLGFILLHAEHANILITMSILSDWSSDACRQIISHFPPIFGKNSIEKFMHV